MYLSLCFYARTSPENPLGPRHPTSLLAKLGAMPGKSHPFTMLERLQKILSARGIASRRKAEELITEGVVFVNGKQAALGQKADPATDTIEVRGDTVKRAQELLYYVLYKPVGVLTSSQLRKEEQTVAWLLPPKLRGLVHPVGRLDKDSEGLLLLTNDGTLAYRLTHPRFDHEKEYEVTTEKPVLEADLRKLEKGVFVLGAKTKPATIKRLTPTRFTIALTEGRNRQIRRMVEKIGGMVKTLKRVRILTLQDAALHSGHLRALTKEEVAAMRHAVGLP